jgi:acyl dehydratase
MVFLQDLPLGADIACGSFRLSRDEIVAFAERFDPQPFHLDEAAAQASYFRGLCASGLHSQAAAIGLMVRAIADVAVIAGGSLDQAKFHLPVRPDQTYHVTARWTDARRSGRNTARGVASIAGEACLPDGTPVMSFGVTYIVACHPTAQEPA